MTLKVTSIFRGYVWIALAFLSSTCPASCQGLGELSGLGAGVGVGAAAGVKAAKTARKNIQSKQASTAAAVYKTAIAYERAGKYWHSAQMYARYGDWRLRAGGSKDNVAMSVFDKASALALKAGKKEEAQRYLRQSIRICGNIHGKQSSFVKSRQAKLTMISATDKKTASKPKADSGK